MLSNELESAAICRDDGCDRLDVHAAHKVRAPRTRHDPVSARPWALPAPRALDHSIAKATSKTFPRHAEAILREVVDDYGPINLRTVQRRLARLVARGHVLRIDLGNHLSAYLRPGSTMVRDIDMIREQVENLFASSSSNQRPCDVTPG